MILKKKIGSGSGIDKNFGFGSGIGYPLGPGPEWSIYAYKQKRKKKHLEVPKEKCSRTEETKDEHRDFHGGNEDKHREFTKSLNTRYMIKFCLKFKNIARIAKLP